MTKTSCEGTLTLLFKKGDQKDPENYRRPFSIFSDTRKLVKNVLTNNQEIIYETDKAKNGIQNGINILQDKI